MPKIIPDIRENILSSAKAQLMHGGFNGLSLRGVANDCGIALGTSYHYFASKTDLAHAVMEMDWNQDIKFINDVDPGKVLPEKLITQLFLAVRKFLKQYDVLILTHRSYPDILEVIGSRHENMVREISTALKQIMQMYGLNEQDAFVDILAECIFATASADTKAEDFEAMIKIYLNNRKQK